MTRDILVALVVTVFSSNAAYAQAKVDQETIKRTSPTDAKQMFDTYCAVCHGTTGVGNGPAASALAKAPADLTKISARNGGIFPDVRVKRYIEGLDSVAAHGSRDMPMWGDLFKGLNANPDIAQLRIQALSDHLKAMQK